jgi:hypothetical protein
MDYVTRQFINLTKKFRKEFRKALNDFQKALHKQTEATQEAAKSQQEQTDAYKLFLAKLDNRPTGESYTKTDKESRKPMEWIKLAVEIAMLFVVAAYAAVTSFQLVEMKIASDAAARSADTAQQQLEASERPWIKILNVKTRGESQIVPALSFQRSSSWPKGTQQATFQVDITYKNIGRSVARVTADFELFLPLWKDGYSNVILADEKKFCDSVTMVDPAQSVVIFPDDAPAHWYGAGAAIVNSDTTTYFSDIKPGIGFVLPVMVICINYQLVGSPKVYQTRALYEVFRKDNRTRFFEAGIGVPAHKIFLIRNPYGDAAY